MSWFCGAVALLAILTQQEVRVVRAAVQVPTSCLDVYRNNETSESGSYVLQNDDGEQYTVYCEFLLPDVYTYIKPTNLDALNIEDQFTDNSEFVLRYRLTNGKQFEEMVQQVRRYRSMNISFQYNTNSGFGDIQNTAMGPYLYVGFLPVEGIRHLFDEQGLSINGRDRIYVNCNGIPFSYFALLYNDAHKNFNNYNYNEYPFERLVSSLANVPAWYYRQTAEAWLYQGTRVEEDREFPEEFFSQFEVRFGGCGGYVTTAKLRDVTGITVGLKSDINALTTPASTTVISTTPSGPTGTTPTGPTGTTPTGPTGTTPTGPTGTTPTGPTGTTPTGPTGTTTPNQPTETAPPTTETSMSTSPTPTGPIGTTTPNQPTETAPPTTETSMSTSPTPTGPIGTTTPNQPTETAPPTTETSMSTSPTPTGPIGTTTPNQPTETAPPTTETSMSTSPTPTGPIGTTTPNQPTETAPPTTETSMSTTTPTLPPLPPISG